MLTIYGLIENLYFLKFLITNYERYYQSELKILKM
jgi:hypothetical protein